MRRCLVLGAAMCLWEDIEAALNLGEYDAVIAAKLAGVAWPGELHAWYSLHSEWMPDFRQRRQARGYPAAREVVCNTKGPGVDRVLEPKWAGQVRSGASGMYAVRGAILDGFDRIVCAGIPMLQQVGRIDGREGWASAGTYQTPVLQARHHMADKVRSVSGWTAEQFGRPTPEWLRG